MTVLTALALCRFLRDAAALVLWGGSLFVVALAPAALRTSLRAFWATIMRLATAALGLALVALLPVQAAALGAGWRDAFDPALLHGVLFETTMGPAWMTQAAAACGLLLARRLPDQPRLWVTVALTGTLLAATVLTGHAAMRDGWAGFGQHGLAVLHILAGGFWLGALLPLVPTLRAAGQPRLHHDVAIALRRFSGLGHGAVALVFATGIGHAVLILGHWPRAFASPYDALLVAKMVLVAIMTGLAILNRYRFVPQILRDFAGATRRIRRATMAEIGLGLGAVALVAVLGLLEPL